MCAALCSVDEFGLVRAKAQLLSYFSSSPAFFVESNSSYVTSMMFGGKRLVCISRPTTLIKNSLCMPLAVVTHCQQRHGIVVTMSCELVTEITVLGSVSALYKCKISQSISRIAEKLKI